MADNWDDRVDSQYSKFERRPVWTAFKYFLGLLAIITVVVVAGGILGWWFSWGEKVGEVTGADNTDAQFTALYEDLNRMEAGVINYCAARDSDTPEGSILIEEPAFAYRARVLSLIADYNRRQDNYFEAGGLIIKPDLPREAPSLQQLVQQHC